MIKRFLAIAMMAIMLFSACAPAMALSKGAPGLSDYRYPTGSEEGARQYKLSFRLEHHLGYKDKWPVYTAPALDAVRAADGKAMVHTSGDVYTACWSGAWLMIRYEKNNGGQRVGWVPRSSINSKTIQQDNNADFAYWTITLNRDCALSDDPLYESDVLAYASRGETLTYLAHYQYNGGREYAYVRGELDGQPICGFVPFEAIDW